MKKIAFVLMIVVILITACTDDKKEEKGVKYTLKVTDGEGTVVTFDIETEREKVGDALRDEGIIAETGYITTVNGKTLDWEKDKAYWRFVINGEESMEGVDDVSAVEGTVYEFVFTKG